MMSPSALGSQKLTFAVGTAFVVVIAVAYVLRRQSGNGTRKQKKKPHQEQQRQLQLPTPPAAECEDTTCSPSECSSVNSECLEQQENEPMQISAIAAPEAAGDDLRLDSGIGSPKGTPSLENRSNSEQLVEQASDFIEESFSAVYSQTKGIDSSSLFVETSTISIAEPEFQIQDIPAPEIAPETPPEAIPDPISEQAHEAVSSDIEEIVAEICGATAKEMTEKATEPVATAIDSPKKMSSPSASCTEIDGPAKQVDFTPGTSPVRESRKSAATKDSKDSSPAKEKVSRRKAASRSKDHVSREQTDPSPTSSKTRDDGDRNNNNTRRQSTESDVVTDSKSEGSADSSKAGSDSCPSSVTSVLYKFKHEFELPSDLCGRLIGRHGSNVKDIREKTGAIVTVRPHPVNLSLKQVYVVGKVEESIKQAMAEIRRKFPTKAYPHLTLSMTDRQGLAGLAGALPPSYLALPEDQDTVVTVTAMDGCNHLHLQSPQNQTFELFIQQEAKMRSVHSIPGSEPPALPESLIRPNAICVISEGFSWYRMVIESVISHEEVRVKYVDYGGYEILPPSRLKQIRSDFIYIPFQGIEVILADMEPIDPDGKWTTDAIEALKNHADETYNLVLARVVGYSGSIPCVQLTCIVRESGEQYSLSHQLIFEGHAKAVTDSNRSSPNANGSECSEGPTFSPADFPQLGATQQTC